MASFQHGKLRGWIGSMGVRQLERPDDFERDRQQAAT